MTIVSERAAARLLMLVTELRAEMGNRRGWQSEIARKTGINQGLLSKLVSQERTSIGLKYVEAVRRAYGLRHEYFHGTREPRSYHDYIAGDADATYPAWRDFIATELGQSMSEPERRTLASTQFEIGVGEPTVALYQAFLLTMRGQLSKQSRTRAARDNERLDRENAIDAEHQRRGKGREKPG